VTGRPGTRTRSAPAETAVALRAIELGWELAGQPSAAQQAFRRRAAAPTILAELVTLVDQAADMKWALARLRLDDGRSVSGEIAVTATFERRLEAAIGAAIRESLARRRAAGIRLGRRPLIPDTVLAQIARDKEAGKSYRRIAQDLQAAGVPTAQGGREWRASTVRAAYLRSTPAAHD
jgi:DNA invertase Pin-like site-specific DNA recombinase